MKERVEEANLLWGKWTTMHRNFQFTCVSSIFDVNSHHAHANFKLLPNSYISHSPCDKEQHKKFSTF